MAFRQKKEADTSKAESKFSIALNSTKKRFLDFSKYLYKEFMFASEFSGVVAVFTLKVFRKTLKAVLQLFWLLIQKPVRKLWIRFFKIVKRTVNILVEPYHSFKNYYKVIKRRLNEAKDIEHISSTRVVLRTLKEGIKRNYKLMFKTALNYSMPVIFIALLCSLVNYTETLTFALDVNYNSKSIGTVSEEYVYTDAENLLSQQIVYDGANDSQTLSTVSKLTLKLAKEEDIISSDQLLANMVMSSGEDITEAVGVYINNKLVASVKNSQPIKDTFTSILNKYKKDNSTQITFADKIELKDGIYLTSTLRDEQELVTLFKSNKSEQRNYKIKKGDTPSGVAEKFDIPLSRLYKLNPSTKKKFIAGDTIKISASVPYLSVKETRRVKYTQTLDYDIKYVDDSSKLKGYTQTIQAGKEGKAIVTADVTYVNGIETSRKVINKKVTKQPVTKKVAKGTKTVSYSYSAGPSAKISGNADFIWPVGGGYTSSHYGYRGGSIHKGTDIAAPAGTPVYASAAGRVSLATWYSGYGKCVIIDHGNGITTLYGHNSSIYVRPGQYVSQGQNIAGVGCTGWSTGNHCHFEIRVNGAHTNPERYIGTR